MVNRRQVDAKRLPMVFADMYYLHRDVRPHPPVPHFAGYYPNEPADLSVHILEATWLRTRATGMPRLFLSYFGKTTA